MEDWTQRTTLTMAFSHNNQLLLFWPLTSRINPLLSTINIYLYIFQAFWSCVYDFAPWLWFFECFPLLFFWSCLWFLPLGFWFGSDFCSMWFLSSFLIVFVIFAPWVSVLVLWFLPLLIEHECSFISRCDSILLDSLNIPQPQSQLVDAFAREICCIIIWVDLFKLW